LVATLTAIETSDSKDERDSKHPPAITQVSYGRFSPFSPFRKLNCMAERFIPPHGGYEDLLSFQKARIVI
jgi:hypothetical protein